MSAYVPGDRWVLAALGTLLALELGAGWWLVRRASGRAARALAWALLVVVTAGVERLCRHEPAGLRMLALIAAALLAMKVVVSVEERERGAAPPTLARWLCFALGWPGMQPRLFAGAPPGPLDGGWSLVARGGAFLVAGAVPLVLARPVWAATQSWPAAAGLLLAGLSLALHFGLCNVLAGLWRGRGVACGALFRAPLRSQSLAEFWARRWNLAFSEMTSIAVYRPLVARFGRGPAIFAGFLVSGLLHEVAISLPVRAGLGLPLLYFALHGTLVLVERALARRGYPLAGRFGRAWTIGWLALPLPLLFHRPFLEGVILPIAGISSVK